ncbi:hypothetical protein EHS25_001945 [Saitozyma podzolica]|jgi:hypothetical protein|uniref:Uncharacterized protein n=1 Tax=Saitozyma podzolica TaxID=1890683 RepID=A0A427YFK4_9TREE|nr:hypothetical protein EHS25_001945 [Saitozyma podzolica]
MSFGVIFSVGNPVAYRVPSLDLPGLVSDVQINFEDGDHVFTSADFKLGTVHSAGNRPLIGRLTFRYSYNAANRTITVCGTDFPSADGMTLITLPDGSNPQQEACFEHAADGTGFAADELSGSRTWNYHSQLMPGAAKVFKSIVRGANEAMIAALEASTSPQLIIQLRTPVPELPIEHYLNLAVVYRQGQFLELYDRSSQYETTDEIRPVDSVWGGEVKMTKNENFANVIGSTPDPKVGRSWIDLWRKQFGYPTSCTSLSFPKGFDCGPTLVGGHVILGKKATKVAAGSNNVYILPICKGHNNNDKIYMAAISYLNGIWLKNYLRQ